ncbi:MAG TPA: cobyrinate a,c-diamide synthase [Methanomicrobiales archaeon]|nr:cobyrinate a,c-diamide synthase [Methanomicrobiales archaeon]
MSRAIPRVVIGGTWSGCGKTTVARGLMAAFAARGLAVQPFKVGPDFIDPTHHTAICGRPSRNLDPFMMGEEEVARVFARASEGADLAIIEGVMGLFDGMDGGDVSSTAQVAELLSAPVVLVVDPRGMSGSVHAVIRGYSTYRPGASPAGIIFNRVASPRHRALIGTGLSARAMGWIPAREELSIGSRHLGLVMAPEVERPGRIEAGIFEECCNLDDILELARAAPPLPVPRALSATQPERVRIGVARDAAFCFTYQENLDRLARAGADLEFTSPLTDPFPDVDGLYLPGGYPELHARALSGSPFLRGLRTACGDGMPVYGECGGLLVLSRSLSAGEGEVAMAGVLPARATITGKVQALGYVEARATSTASLLPPGLSFRGHEFHYSAIECERDARFSLDLGRGKGIRGGRDGLTEGNTVGTYTHAYFTDEFAESLVRAAEKSRRA